MCIRIGSFIHKAKFSSSQRTTVHIEDRYRDHAVTILPIKALQTCWHAPNISDLDECRMQDTLTPPGSISFWVILLSYHCCVSSQCSSHFVFVRLVLYYFILQVHNHATSRQSAWLFIYILLFCYTLILIRNQFCRRLNQLPRINSGSNKVWGDCGNLLLLSGIEHLSNIELLCIHCVNNFGVFFPLD